MKTLLLIFILGCYPIYHLQAQTDLAKIISGTYKCSAHIGTFGKPDIDKEGRMVTIKVAGNNRVSVSLEGATSTYELTVEQEGTQYISGNAIVKGMSATLALELGYKPAKIRGGNANEAATQENKEVWWFEGIANGDKPESLAKNEEIEEKKEATNQDEENKVGKEEKGDITNTKGISYPKVNVEGYGEVPFPEGPFTPNNTLTRGTEFTPKFKTDFKSWWQSKNRPWPAGSVEIHHIKPLAHGGTNTFENLVPLITPEHLKFTSWWRNYPKQ